MDTIMTYTKQRVPKLRFPEFEGELKNTKIGNISEVQRGASSQYATYVKNEKDGIRFIRIGDFLGSEPVYVIESDDIRRFILNEGDILIAGTGATAGITFKVPKKYHNMAYSYNAPRIRVSEAVSEYILLYLKTEYILRQQKALFTGNAQPFLDINAIKGLSISLPSPPEQNKIASFLTSVDSKIEALTKKKELLEKYKKGMMQKLFSQAIRFKDDEGNDYPNWGIAFIGDLAIVKTGNKDTNNKVDSGKYPFYVRSNTVERIDTYEYDEVAILTSGDGVGVGKNFHFIDGKFDCHQRVYCIRGFNEAIVPKYMYQYFSEKFYKRVIRLSAKNSVDSVRMDMITKMEIPFPSLSEQNKIADILSSIDRKIDLANEELEKTKKFKKGLLQQMFI